MRREGEICDKCRKKGRKPETVPEEYRELFHAAQVLLDKGETDEYVIIPTLAFAAKSSEMPRLASVRDKFAEVHKRYAEVGKEDEAWKSEEWLELDTQFFLNCSDTLKAIDMKEGVLIVRSAPIDAFRYEDEETGLIDEVEINVHRHSVDEDEATNFYERALKLSGISYREGRGDIRPRYTPPHSNPIVIMAGYEAGTRKRRFRDGTWQQGPFPGPRTFRAMYVLLRQMRREEQAATGNVPPEGTKKTQSKKPYNIILACAYWYVGNRGEVLSSPPGSLLQRRTSNLLKKHLLEPCQGKIPGKIRTDAPRGAKNVQQRIHRIDNELRLLDARIIPLLSK